MDIGSKQACSQLDAMIERRQDLLIYRPRSVIEIFLENIQYRYWPKPLFHTIVALWLIAYLAAHSFHLFTPYINNYTAGSSYDQSF